MQREAQNRHSGEALGKAVGVFEHFARRSAASVTVTVGVQGNACIFLLRKSLPRASDISGNIFADIGGLAILRSVFHKRPRGDEGGKNFASVNSLPKEGIHGKRVRIIPADFRGDEVIHAALFQNLRHGRTVTEHVGQEADAAFLSELLAHIFLSVEKLAHKAFAARQIAIAFKI